MNAALTTLAIVGLSAAGSAFMGFQLWTAFTKGTVRSGTGRVLTREGDRLDFWIYVVLAAAWFAVVAMALGLAAMRLLR